MIIANDPERKQFIHEAPDGLVPLSYITQDLWPKLGFLPIDPENPGVALIAEYILNELILKNSDSLNKLNLQHLKELFCNDDVEEEEEDAEQSMGDNEPRRGLTKQAKEVEENYSDESEGDDFRAMDIGQLRKQ